MSCGITVEILKQKQVWVTVEPGGDAQTDLSVRFLRLSMGSPAEVRIFWNSFEIFEILLWFFWNFPNFQAIKSFWGYGISTAYTSILIFNEYFGY